MKLEVKMKGHNSNTTEVFFDGKKVDGLIGLDFNIGADMTPYANVRIILEEINVKGDFYATEVFYSTEDAINNEKLGKTIRIIKRQIKRLLDLDLDEDKKPKYYIRNILLKILKVIEK